MLESLKSFIAKNKLIASNQQLLLACSGGIDSMVLANLLLKLEQPFAIAHINHGLRNEESDGDADFVRNYCQQQGITFHLTQLNLAYLEETGGNMQSVARDERYAIFEDLCQTHGYVQIATAHHLDDNIETVFHRFFRGTGLKGMTGIPVLRDRIIRPLLFATKKEIIAYANLNEIAYREDSSNTKNKYTRNFLRNQIIPEIAKHYPQLNKRLSASIQNFEGEFALLQHLMEQKKSQLLHITDDLIVIQKDAIQTFLKIPFFLFKLLEEYGLSKTQCENILSAWDDTSKQVLAPDYSLTVERDSLIIKKRDNKKIAPLQIDAFPFSFRLNSDIILEMKIIPNTGISFSDYQAIFDKSKLCDTLTIDIWNEGDTFKPLGMEGKSQKIKDFLVHVKHPSHAKKECLVLRSGEEIAWVIPYRISEDFKVNENTQELVVVNLNRDVGVR